MWTVYIILCKDNSLYTGITTNVARRFAEHKKGKGGYYTKAKKVKKLLYTEKLANQSSALKREAEIKSWTRTKKLQLIKSISSTTDKKNPPR